MEIRWIDRPFAGSLRQRLAASRNGFALYWLGQAGFLIHTRRYRIVIDPYLSDSLAAKYRGRRFSHERMMPAPILPPDLGAVDLVLCTHHHTDHMDPDTLAPIAVASPRCRFVVPAAAEDEAGRRIGVPADRLCPLDAGGSLEPLPGINVRAVRAAHEALETDAAGRHRYLGYVVEAGGLRVLHSGDTVPFAGMAEEIAECRPDLALLPVNGRSDELRAGGIAGNLTLDEALALCANSGIPAMIAHHYGMFAFNTVASETIDQRAEAPGQPVRLLRARTQVEYVPSFP